MLIVNNRLNENVMSSFNNTEQLSCKKRLSCEFLSTKINCAHYSRLGNGVTVRNGVTIFRDFGGTLESGNGVTGRNGVTVTGWRIFFRY